MFLKPELLFSSFPRSGSNSIAKIIQNICGDKSKIVSLKSHSGNGHSVLKRKWINLIARTQKLQIIYGHYLPTEQNINTVHLNKDLPLIISIRPIPDVLLSLIEYIEIHGWGPIDNKISNMPKTFLKLENITPRERMRVMINIYASWYVEFLASWLEFSKTIQSDLLIVKYEELLGNPSLLIKKITNHLPAYFLSGKPEFGIQENMNIGILGRGTQLMDDNLYRHLSEIIDCFPTINQHGYKNYLLGKAS